MADAASIAQDPTAPAEERYDAQVYLAKANADLSRNLFGAPEVQDTIAQIRDMFHEQDLAKAGSNLIVGPWSGAAKNKVKGRGPESIFLDDMQITIQNNGYWERPGVLSFGSMRAMVESTPILNSIILTRQRQVQRFCQARVGDTGPGFVIKHIDPTHESDERETQAIQLLQKFLLNGGWEFDPRKRKPLKRDTFAQFMAKSVRDSLVMDSAPIETEWKRDKSLGIDGFYAVDGATIRLCTELGYEGDDQVFALQVIEGNIRTAYTYEDLIYEVRNPRTDVLASGYGHSETEMLIRIVTYLLNTMTYNAGFFDKNSIPRGILNLYGNYTNEDIASFKRQWNAMLRGAQNSHNLPVMVSKDTESKADFVEVGGQMTEMAFGKWLSFLCAIACAVYGTTPEEVNLESFSMGKSSLSGSDTEEKLVSSSDKGLRPLLSYYQSVISDFIIQPFAEDLVFRFEGLDDEDAKNTFEMRKLTATVNEGRKMVNLDPLKGPLGDAPLNPTLISPWQAIEGIGQEQPPTEDFGDEPGEGDGFGNGAPGDDDGSGGDGAEDGAPDGGQAGAAAGDDLAGEDDDGYGTLPQGMSKSFNPDDYGLPVLKFEV